MAHHHSKIWVFEIPLCKRMERGTFVAGSLSYLQKVMVSRFGKFPELKPSGMSCGQFFFRNPRPELRDLLESIEIAGQDNGKALRRFGVSLEDLSAQGVMLGGTCLARD